MEKNIQDVDIISMDDAQLSPKILDSQLDKPIKLIDCRKKLKVWIIFNFSSFGNTKL